MSDRHRCNQCNALHSPPKTSRLIGGLIQTAFVAVALTLGALHTDGNVSLALWGALVWVALKYLTVTLGMVVAATAAVKGEELA